MKKAIIIVIIAGGLFAGCRKNRTCECTSGVISRTSNDPAYTYTPMPASTSSTKYIKIKKKNAELYCVSSESTRNYTQASYTGTAVVNYQVTEVYKDDCKLK